MPVRPPAASAAAMVESKVDTHGETSPIRAAVAPCLPTLDANSILYFETQTASMQTPFYIKNVPPQPKCVCDHCDVRRPRTGGNVVVECDTN